jgi:hypothetical protein
MDVGSPGVLIVPGKIALRIICYAIWSYICFEEETNKCAVNILPAIVEDAIFQNDNRVSIRVIPCIRALEDFEVERNVIGYPLMVVVVFAVVISIRNRPVRNSTL